MKPARIVPLVLLAMIASASNVVQAQITWNWSFGTNTGTFFTDGTAVGGVAAPGTYNFIDFAVTSSGDGATIGSVSGGQYSASGFCSFTPYDFNWNGSAATFWNSEGCNSFDWWPFTDLIKPNSWVFFGWDSDNTNGCDDINDPTRGAIYHGNICTATGYPLTVSVAGTSTVPEPASVALLATGLVGVFGAVRRRLRNESA